MAPASGSDIKPAKVTKSGLPDLLSLYFFVKNSPYAIALKERMKRVVPQEQSLAALPVKNISPNAGMAAA